MLEKPLIVLGIGGIINYRKFTKNEAIVPEHLSRHFNSEDDKGVLENEFITLIDKTDGRNPEKRAYWRLKCKACDPFKLHVEDSF